MSKTLGQTTVVVHISSDLQLRMLHPTAYPNANHLRYSPYRANFVAILSNQPGSGSWLGIEDIMTNLSCSLALSLTKHVRDQGRDTGRKAVCHYLQSRFQGVRRLRRNSQPREKSPTSNVLVVPT